MSQQKRTNEDLLEEDNGVVQPKTYNSNSSFSNSEIYDDIVNRILNREEFNYDLNGDALYHQYKDKYTQQGKMAMQDVMGQASAMTGGYGNSYAATAGNQAYQASLENLNDVIPELYQIAYDKYNKEGEDLYNQYSILANDRAFEESVRQYDESQREAARQHDNSINVRREEIYAGNEGDGGDFTYIDNEITQQWKSNLPSKEEFDNANGYEYNGVKYKNWEAFIDAKLSDAIDNGDLTEEEAASIIVDLGLA